MNYTIKYDPSGKSVTLVNISVSNPDFVSVISSQPESRREQTVLDIIAVGSAAIRRVQTTVDVDFVDNRFGALSAKFEKAIDGFEKETSDVISKRFSPTESGSYTKHIAELIAAARKDFQVWTGQLEKDARELLDPDKKSSAVGRLETLLEGATQQFEEMFDPTRKESYAGQLNQKLAQVFGTDGRAGFFDTSLNEALSPVLRELRELKEKVEARKAAEQVIASSSLKGLPFQELVHRRLSDLAKPFGDDVSDVSSGSSGSRAGDFLVTVNGSGKRVVVEARDKRQMSLPAIKEELERDIKARDAHLALYVSSGPEMLPQHVGSFQIYGEKLVTTMENLPIAYRVARVMVLMEAPDGDVDTSALRAILTKIKEGTHSLRNAKSKATQIENCIAGIRSDVGEAERIILGLVAHAESLLGLERAA